MSKKKVGIIGGSKIDTEIGVRFFTSKGLHTKGYPVAPEAKQYELLLRNAPKIKSRVIEIIRKITNEGLNSVIIYCNSLSSIINAENIAANEKIRIMTPLSTYKEVANIH
ncbi:MAG TPA: hypothetical protein VK105_14270 [Virgibacillus sp.]|nr:hypothetical protein [Virgibacillus sp.]HLR68272.1 hypothetical protein [Virgibacillus sp.]